MMMKKMKISKNQMMMKTDLDDSNKDMIYIELKNMMTMINRGDNCEN